MTTPRSQTTEQSLRTILLYLSGLVWAGTIVELILTEHTESWIQFIPFVVSALGLLAVTYALQKPGTLSFRFLRTASIISIISGVVGIYQHYAANYELEAEVNASASMFERIWDSFFGASPILASGIVALAAVLALLSIWRHPDGTSPAKSTGKGQQ